MTASSLLSRFTTLLYHPFAYGKGLDTTAVLFADTIKEAFPSSDNSAHTLTTHICHNPILPSPISLPPSASLFKLRHVTFTPPPWSLCRTIPAVTNQKTETKCHPPRRGSTNSTHESPSPSSAGTSVSMVPITQRPVPAQSSQPNSELDSPPSPQCQIRCCVPLKGPKADHYVMLQVIHHLGQCIHIVRHRGYLRVRPVNVHKPVKRPVLLQQRCVYGL